MIFLLITGSDSCAESRRNKGTDCSPRYTLLATGWCDTERQHLVAPEPATGMGRLLAPGTKGQQWGSNGARVERGCKGVEMRMEW